MWLFKPREKVFTYSVAVNGPEWLFNVHAGRLRTVYHGVEAPDIDCAIGIVIRSLPQKMAGWDNFLSFEVTKTSGPRSV